MSTGDNDDPYAVLGVSPSATQAEITHAYRAKLRAHHPDMRGVSATAEPEPDAQLQRILAAYAILRDPRTRADYDRVAARRRRQATPPHTGSRMSSAQGPVTIPVRHGRRREPRGQGPPLWIGPLRRHR